MPNPFALPHRLFLPVAVAALAALGAAQAPRPGALQVRGLPDEAPLAVAAHLDPDALRVQLDVKPGWHLYAKDVGGGQPVAIRVRAGSFAAAGELAAPGDAKGLITGKAELRLPLRRVAAGDHVAATMSFMVCDALQCLPPMEIEIGSPFRVLLVAVDEGERTQRIAAFLRERGIEPLVSTYATVSTELCDAHEVVIADSPTFNQVRGKKVDARSFPRTSSPIVAVGFLGTQLLVGHKVAMACGYI